MLLGLPRIFFVLLGNRSNKLYHNIIKVLEIANLAYSVDNQHSVDLASMCFRSTTLILAAVLLVGTVTLCRCRGVARSAAVNSVNCQAVTVQ